MGGCIQPAGRRVDADSLAACWGPSTPASRDLFERRDFGEILGAPAGALVSNHRAEAPVPHRLGPDAARHRLGDRLVERHVRELREKVDARGGRPS